MAPILGILASQISGHLNPTTGFVSIATTTVGAGGASSISFSSIPSIYKHLQIRGISKPSTSGDYDWSIQFNSDTGTNYSKHQVFGDGTSAVATGTASQNQIPGAFNQYTDFGGFIVDILDYQNTSKNKTVRTLTGIDRNGNGLIGLRSGYWNSASAISSIQIIPTSGSTGIAQYSSFALYGIQGA
jgi:hypothetical protein